MRFFVKNFTDWFSLKIKLDKLDHNPPIFNEGEVWWCSIGENIGGEISGKGMYSRRPVLVVRKLGRFSFIGVPLTSQLKSGTWYFNLNIKDEKNSIILSQVRHFDYRRMDKILSKIALSDLNSIKIALARLIKPE